MPPGSFQVYSQSCCPSSLPVPFPCLSFSSEMGWNGQTLFLSAGTPVCSEGWRSICFLLLSVNNHFWMIPQGLETCQWSPSVSLSIDPEHQRANGNMKYFEYIMAKEKEANKSSTDSEEQQEKETEVKKKDYLPERRKYEMLCRGEGLKMVKWSRLFSNVWNQTMSGICVWCASKEVVRAAGCECAELRIMCWISSLFWPVQ